MLVSYVVNEEPAYIGMLCHSLSSLRKHNPSLPVNVYYVQDGCKDTRNAHTREIRRITNKHPQNLEGLKGFCEQLNVNLLIRPVPEESKGYFPLHRLVFKEIQEEKVLLLDSDTFIFGDISKLCEKYHEFDFVATPNNWAFHYDLPGFPNFKSFNSGVVLCQNGIFQKWIASLDGYCKALEFYEHPLSEWLWSVSENCLGREECAASLFVLDNKINYSYFDNKDVQMGRFSGDALICHTLNENYVKIHNMLFPPRKIVFKPKLK